MSSLSRVAVLLAGCTAALPAGCGSKFVQEKRLPDTGATLSGTITYNGDKVRYAVVSAVGPSSSGIGGIGEDGRYKISNVPLGEVRLTVNTTASRGEYQSMVMGAGAYKGPDGKGRNKVDVPKFIEVPERFAEAERSGLKTTVNGGENTYDIVISGK